MKTKVCSKCSKSRDIKFFYKKGKGFTGQCKSCIKDKQNKYYLEYRDNRIAYQKSKYNAEEKAQYDREYRRTHKKEYAVYRETYKDRRNARHQERRKIYPNFKIARNLRSRLYDAMKGNQKTGSAVRDLGCSIEELRIILESKFYPHPITGEHMGWNNYKHDGWHIDHIKPLMDFDLTDPVQTKQVCHYTNLQPLWAEENYAKQRKIQL